MKKQTRYTITTERGTIFDMTTGANPNYIHQGACQPCTRKEAADALREIRKSPRFTRTR